MRCDQGNLGVLGLGLECHHRVGGLLVGARSLAALGVVAQVVDHPELRTEPHLVLVLVAQGGDVAFAQPVLVHDAQIGEGLLDLPVLGQRVVEVVDPAQPLVHLAGCHLQSGHDGRSQPGVVADVDQEVGLADAGLGQRDDQVTRFHTRLEPRVELGEAGLHALVFTQPLAVLRARLGR